MSRAERIKGSGAWVSCIVLAFCAVLLSAAGGDTCSSEGVPTRLLAADPRGQWHIECVGCDSDEKANDPDTGKANGLLELHVRGGGVFGLQSLVGMGWRGRYLVVVQAGELVLLDMRSGSRRLLESDADSGPSVAGMPAWDADIEPDQGLVCYGTVGTRGSPIHVLELQAGVVRRIAGLADHLMLGFSGGAKSEWVFAIACEPMQTPRTFWTFGRSGGLSTISDTRARLTARCPSGSGTVLAACPPGRSRLHQRDDIRGVIGGRVVIRKRDKSIWSVSRDGTNRPEIPADSAAVLLGGLAQPFSLLTYDSLGPHAGWVVLRSRGSEKRIVRDANYPDDTHLSVIWGGGAPWEYVIRQDGRSSNVFVNLLSGEVVELDGRVVMLNRAQGRVVLLAERQLWVAELCDQGARFKLPLGTVGAGAVRRLRICGNWIAFDGKLVEITHPSSVLPYDGTATAVSNEGSVLTGKILHGHLLGPLRWIDASAK